MTPEERAVIDAAIANARVSQAWWTAHVAEKQLSPSYEETVSVSMIAAELKSKFAQTELALIHAVDALEKAQAEATFKLVGEAARIKQAQEPKPCAH